MKLRDIFLVVFLLVVSFGYSQRTPKIRGSKVVIDVRQDLPPFNIIELNADLDINFQKSTDYGYSLTIDDNLVDVLKFRVVDNTLTIDQYYKVTSKKKMEITVFYNEITAIKLREGKIEIENEIVTDVLDINMLGSSKLKLNANTRVVNVMMYENSFADLNIQTDTINMNFKNRVDAKLDVISNVSSLSLTDNAQIKIQGSTHNNYLGLSANASIKGEKFKTSYTSLSISDSASAYIDAETLLELNSKDSAKTYFYGPGKVNVFDFLDTSQLNKRNRSGE